MKMATPAPLETKFCPSGITEKNHFFLSILILIIIFNYKFNFNYIFNLESIAVGKKALESPAKKKEIRVPTPSQLTLVSFLILTPTLSE